MSVFGQRATLSLVVILAAIAVRLGFWQLDRLDMRRATNATLTAARDLPPLDLTAGDLNDSTLVGRRITATGRFTATGELLLRNRAFRDAPGLHVVTPFRLEGTGRSVWVLRGFVNAADAVTPARPLPSFASGDVTVTGVALAMPVTTNRGQPLVIGVDTTWQRSDAALLRERLPTALPILVYLEARDTAVGGLPTIDPPSLDEGPHLSYAIQWFGIASAILAFGWIVVRKRGDPGPSRPRAAP